jgi:hypothetical protein
MAKRTLVESDLSGEAFLETMVESAREQEVGRISLLPVPPEYIGKRLVVSTLDGEETIKRAIFKFPNNDLPGYFTDHKRPRVSEARGEISSAAVFHNTFVLRDSESRFLRSNLVQYYIPLLDPETLEPLVSVEVFDRQ